MQLQVFIFGVLPQLSAQQCSHALEYTWCFYKSLLLGCMRCIGHISLHYKGKNINTHITLLHVFLSHQLLLLLTQQYAHALEYTWWYYKWLLFGYRRCIGHIALHYKGKNINTHITLLYVFLYHQLLLLLTQQYTRALEYTRCYHKWHLFGYCRYIGHITLY